MPDTDWRARCRKFRADNKTLRDKLEFTERALDLALDEAARLRKRVAELVPPLEEPPRRWWQVGAWK